MLTNVIALHLINLPSGKESMDILHLACMSLYHDSHRCTLRLTLLLIHIIRFSVGAMST